MFARGVKRKGNMFKEIGTMKKFVLFAVSLTMVAAFVVPATAALTSWTWSVSDPNAVSEETNLATIQLKLIEDDLVVSASDVANGTLWADASFSLIDGQERSVGTAVALPSAGPFAHITPVDHGNQFSLGWDGFGDNPVEGDWFTFTAPEGIAVGDLFDIFVYDPYGH